MTPVTLIQLVSDQTVQNLLPVLRLNPAGVINLFTERTKAKVPFLEKASHTAGENPKYSNVSLASAMPGIAETFQAVQDAISGAKANGTLPVVNFTGGTKLMGVGAYAAARGANVPSLYVDTLSATFVDGMTSPQMAELMEDAWTFDSFHHRLQTQVLAVANGVVRVSDGRNWAPFVELARYLLDHPEQENECHQALFGENGYFPRAREPRTPKDWLVAIDRPMKVGIKLAELITKSGIARRAPDPKENGTILLPDSTRGELEALVDSQESNKNVKDFHPRYFSAIRPLQEALTFLTGGWWEIIVCDAAQRSGRFRDLRWSADVGDINGADTEEDILGLDGVELLYISCKRGGLGAKLINHLQEMNGRATSIGGSFCRRFLAILNPPYGRTWKDLEEKANSLGVRLIHRKNIDDPEVFSRRR